ncbi:MAG: hypothetical protein AAF490_19520 [Chloroflexota bacterium]
MNTLAKKMITLRLDEDLIEKLKKVAKKEDSLFYDRDRTWLIEYAIKKTYGPIIKNEAEGKTRSA